MTKRMLIDAVHPEDVRVVVADNNRLEEFDFETATRKQIKGNIYLAKVTRVEPSLQAAFVEYGGNKQGFLPFSEIHPDYYHIPVEDKRALLKEAAKAAEEEEEAAEKAEAEEAARHKPKAEEEGREGEELAAEDGLVVPRVRPNFYRRYKIQEVIKRNQILLVQVIKEERGNKGASLTAYISLPGRYCVLMPNSQKTGGVSRRIANSIDRKRLKKLVAELELEEGMSVIIRTAGLDRKKSEIKRDCSYLLKLWNTIREQAVSLSAPALVNEEGNIIRRALRDVYHSDIEEIIVEGDAAYNQAKELMKLMMPSHVKRVKEHKDPVPLFRKLQVEDELDLLHSNAVPLKSGGSIVISPTEALVSIDVNSGRSTREHNIEETALKTNQEAASEIARQLRLRDLAGLVVIDFIDMIEYRNRRTIERALKDALKTDRAKIQVGRISNFGLLEMSRQRLRSSLMESSTSACPMCKGSGVVRSRESIAMMHLRALEGEAIRARSGNVALRTSQEAAYHLLNHRRSDLIRIESESGAKVTVLGDNAFIGEDYVVEQLGSGRPDARRDEDGQGGRRDFRRDRNRDRGWDKNRDRNRFRDRGRDWNAPQNESAPATAVPASAEAAQETTQPPQNRDRNNGDLPNRGDGYRRRGGRGRGRRRDWHTNDHSQPSSFPSGQEAAETQDSVLASETSIPEPARTQAPKPEPFPVSREPAREFALAEVTTSDAQKSVLRGLWKKITD